MIGPGTMTLPFADAAGVALLETATRVWPLSEGGHAALLDLLLGVNAPPALTLAANSGALLGTILFLRSSARTALVAAARGVRRPSELRITAAGRSVQVIALGSVAMLVVTLLVRDRAVAWGREPFLVGAGLLVSAGALASTFWAPRGSRRVPTLWGALVVGVATGAAALPGLSQTGLGLVSLLWLGLSAESAFEVCFLLMIPAQVGLIALRAGELHGAFGWAWPSLFAVSTTAALLALYVLRTALVRRLLPFFSLYLVPLGIAWGYARP
jgi:undecaprenyl pyrophosphate phosphatase UppP